MNHWQLGSAVQDTRIGIKHWRGQETRTVPVTKAAAAAPTPKA